MAILNTNPGSLTVGTASSSMTINTSTLVSEFSITDGYWSVPANWSAVDLHYHDATNTNHRILTFQSSGFANFFSTSATAKTNTWIVTKLVIRDFDGGAYIIDRGNFLSGQSQFDIAITAVFGSGTLRPEYNESFALAFWIKTSVSTGYFFANSEGSPNFRGVNCGLLSGDLYMDIRHGAEFIEVHKSGLNLADNSPHLVVLAYNGNGLASGVKMYKDGSDVGALTVDQDNLGGLTIVGTGAITLGQIINTTFYTGFMDEVAFIRGSFSGSEVTEMYNSGTPGNLQTMSFVNKVVSWWRFETALSPADSDTGTIYDRASGTHNGTATNTSAGFLASSPFGGSFSLKAGNFDGINDYISIA